MLQRRLTLARRVGVVLVAGLATACAGVDGTEGGALRENVIEPGITAIGEAGDAACGINADILRTALETYLLIEGEPAPDEAALVSEGYLRQEMADWDIVDGAIVAENAACGPVPDRVTSTVEIVTEAEGGSDVSVDDLLAELTPEMVSLMGGPECARQFAVVAAGIDRYVAATGAEPDSLDQIAAAGFFDEPVTMWQVVDDVLRPTDESACTDFVALQEADSASGDDGTGE